MYYPPLPYSFYTKPATNWTYDERLTPSDSQEFDDFGHSMDISDDENYLLIGAPQIGDGEASIFTLSGNTWTQAAILLRPTGFSDEEFHPVGAVFNYMPGHQLFLPVVVK